MSGASLSAAQRERAGATSARPSPALKWRRLRFVPLGIAASALLSGLWVSAPGHGDPVFRRMATPRSD